MEVTDSTAAAKRGLAETPSESTGNPPGGQRFMDRKEFVDRLAQAMRLKSGLDLPHAYFVEQVKLQLAGSPAFDKSLLGSEGNDNHRMPAHQSADCFRAWAIPE